MGKHDGQSIKHMRHEIDDFRFRRFVDIRHYFKLFLAVAIKDGSCLLHQGLTDERKERLQLLCHRFCDVEHRCHAFNVFSFAA